ncbi:MAG: hypothetical protein R3296_10105 [Oleiphilaceae bacterium]|nr:hypothetical protein [Oleiphilaceae bacterium]
MYNSDQHENDQDLHNRQDSNEEDGAADAIASIALIMLFVAAATTYVIQQGLSHL